MAIQVGDALPDGTLQEYIEVEGNGCTVGPNAFKVSDLTKGKKVVIFAVPGAFTPGCSNTHLPGFLKNVEKLKAKGIDEILCLSVNDAFVMGAWARDQKVSGKIRLMADGSADYVRKLGLEFDLTGKGMGVRSQRFSLLVDNGRVAKVNVDKPGQIEASSAETMLSQL